MNWNQSVFKDMVELASRAPSVHNVQPWKLRYFDSGFDLFQSVKRRLHVGDPKLHDNDVSLGAFIELCSIFLKNIGLEISINDYQSEKIKEFDDEFESRFKINLTKTEPMIDPLLDYINHRKSFRGLFSKDQIIDEKALANITIPGLTIKWITGPQEMKRWANIYDISASQINQTPGYFKELVHWIRFNKSHLHYYQDGLNSQSLSLSALEAFAGSCLMKEFIFKFFSKFKMEKLLMSEAPQIMSSYGICIIYASKELNSIEMGRAFVRFWLTLTKMQIFVCPLSSLVDFTGSLKILNSFHASHANTCLNVFRFGKVADEKAIYTSPRLGIERIIF